MRKNKHAESHNPVQAPRTAKQFVAQWNVPDVDALINGNEQFPDMYHRQDRLVGQVLDACVVLHVYERLKRQDSLKTLSFFFPAELSVGEIETLERQEKTHPGANEEKLTLLVKMSQERSVLKRINGHRTLVPEPTWNNYLSAFKHFQEEEKKYETEVKIAIREHGNIDHLRSAPKRPPDPRITAINEHIRSTIQLLDPGPKEPGAIKRKDQKKKEQVKDVNRIGVLPVTPEYAKDFIKIMELLNAPKVISPHGGEGEGRRIPRLFEEPAEIFENGYFNQRLFLALDRPKTRTGRTLDNTATIAEIKIVPSAMVRAEKLTDKLKPLMEECSIPSKYTAQAQDFTPALMESRHEQLKEDYIKKQRAFTEQIQKYRKEDKSYTFDYKLPPFPADAKLVKNETYTHLRDQLMVLALKINEDAIRSENKDWQWEYLTTGVFQKICDNDDFFKRDAEKLNTKDIQRMDNLIGGVMKRIAEANSWDLKAIESKMRQGYSEAKWKEAARARQERALQ
jgi:hypothetical protein